MGYLNPVTNIIQSTPTFIDCDDLDDIPVFIDNRTYLYQYRSGTIIEAGEIPALHIFQIDHDASFFMMPNIPHKLLLNQWVMQRSRNRLDILLSRHAFQKILLKAFGFTLKGKSIIVPLHIRQST